jgi:putative ABC transport system permease protein
MWIEAWRQDIRFAARQLRRNAGMTAIAVITLALGFGANTALFSVVNGVLLAPLPYPSSDRLVAIYEVAPGFDKGSMSYLNFLDWQRMSRTFSSMAIYRNQDYNFAGTGERGSAERVTGMMISADFFRTLGQAPVLGRDLGRDDDRAGATPVVVLSGGFWRRRFGASASVLGQTVALNGKPYTVIGIMPESFTFAGATRDVYTPIGQWTDANFRDRGIEVSTHAVGRLAPAASIAQARADMNIVARDLAVEYPAANKNIGIALFALKDDLVGNVQRLLYVLLGAVGCLLLIACVNVANLLLARANSRAREVAVRAAVGAGRARLIQQFLVESVVLGVGGAVAGLAVAYWAIRALVALGPSRIPRLGEVGVDWRVLMFVVTVAVATSVVFGLVPALATTGRSFARLISTAGRGLVGEAGTRLRRTLVVAEMALAVVLLVAAGLLMRSYQRISHVDPGFSPDRVLTFAIGLPESKYKTSAAAAGFVQAFTDSLAARPGVEAAAGVFGLPLDESFTASSSFTRSGETDSADSPSVGMRIVTPDYFKALRIPLRAGRLFDGHDDETGAEVVVINEEAARRYWPGMNPIGQQLHLGVRLAEARSGQKTIVGVVGDVKWNGLDATPPPEVYLPHKQHAVDSLTIVVRTAGEPAAFVPVARADLATLDRELPISAVRTMDEVVGRSIVERRFMMLLLGTFAAVAILLAAIGVYGVLAYIVSQRTQEIGVRLAIGASPADVVRLFLREGVALAAAGLLIGVVSALAAGRVLASLLFGVTTTDPLTFVGVTLALGVAALCASYLPARRAAAVDPMTALRTD